MPEYTVLAATSVVLVLLLERFALRTGLLRDPSYWISLAICFGFMVLVNGWLTKLSAPIVIYTRSENLGVRFPWDIPVEDFAFGWSMLTLTMLLWDRAGRRDASTR
ncbi:MAG: lycopene cyclase domain-containing protein [Actinomycetes bacterium]